MEPVEVEDVAGEVSIRMNSYTSGQVQVMIGGVWHGVETITHITHHAYNPMFDMSGRGFTQVVVAGFKDLVLDEFPWFET